MSFELIIEQLKAITFSGNSVYGYILAGVIFIGLIIVLKIFQVIILTKLNKLAKKTKTGIDDAVIKIFKEIRPPFYFFVALYFGLSILNLPDWINTAVKALLIIAVVYEVIRACEKLIDCFMEIYLRKMELDGGDEHSRAMVKSARTILRIVLWLLGIVLMLANLGINVTSIVASLGIGGIAIALAIQNILGDIFSSFSIYIDKPFKVGDYIKLGKDSGTVEKIGMKTTRIRTLQGEELVVSNKELTSVRVQNFKQMEERRIAFNLGVVYGLKPEKLEKIPLIIKDIIERETKAKFDRCHFKEYGDFALIFETVFYVSTSEYAVSMDVRQRINLEIYRQFAEEKIEFAYPTQTVFVKK